MAVDKTMAPPPEVEQAAAPLKPYTGRRQWLTMEDFCEELGVPMSTAYKWCSHSSQHGEVPRFPRACRLPNGKIRIRRDWLDEWLDGLPTPTA